LLRQVAGEPNEASRVGSRAAALEHAVDHERIIPARQVADVARLAEPSRSIRRLGDLCDVAGIGQPGTSGLRCITALLRVASNRAAGTEILQPADTAA
jgi:hypothetical protein